MLKTNLIAIVLFFSAVSVSFAQKPKHFTGKWEGSLLAAGVDTKIIVILEQLEKHVLTGNLSVPQENLTNKKITDVKLDQSAIYFKVQDIPGDPDFTGNISPDKKEIKGTFKQSGIPFPIVFKKVQR